MPAKARADPIMFSLLTCSAAVVAATWLLANDSGVLLRFVYYGAAAVLVVRLLYATLKRPSLPHVQALALLVGTAPLLWYLIRLLMEPIAVAASRNSNELTGAVLPGVVLGLTLALDLRWILRQPMGDRARQRRAAVLRWGMAVNALTVAGAAIFLLSRSRETIFLISASLLEGAETYQVLGDMLLVNVLTVLVLVRSGASAAGPEGTPWKTWLWSVMGLGVAAIACAILLGSNKLLVACLLLMLLLGFPALARWARSSPLAFAGLLLLLTGVSVPLLVVSFQLEALNDLLALTRLLDYGNVDSLLDTPSIASRLAIFDECSARQFELGPVWGDLAAEFRTCGDGHYVHSLLSVQTHLGAVGSLLFLAAVALAAWNIGRDEVLQPLRPLFVTVIFVALIGAFFTWLPLWHMLALVAAAPYRPGSLGARVTTPPGGAVTAGRASR